MKMCKAASEAARKLTLLVISRLISGQLPVNSSHCRVTPGHVIRCVKLHLGVYYHLDLLYPSAKTFFNLSFGTLELT